MDDDLAVYEAWAERAAIYEYDGGLTRAAAEAEATRWLAEKAGWCDNPLTHPAKPRVERF